MPRNFSSSAFEIFFSLASALVAALALLFIVVSRDIRSRASYYEGRGMDSESALKIAIQQFINER